VTHDRRPIGAGLNVIVADGVCAIAACGEEQLDEYAG
jgi:hypothetical protein